MCDITGFVSFRQVKSSFRKCCRTCRPPQTLDLWSRARTSCWRLLWKISKSNRICLVNLIRLRQSKECFVFLLINCKSSMTRCCGKSAVVLVFMVLWVFLWSEACLSSFVSIHKHRTSLCSFADVLLYLMTVCPPAVFQTHHLCQQHILPAHHWHRQLHQQAGQVWWPSLLQPSPYDEACRGEKNAFYIFTCMCYGGLVVVVFKLGKVSLPVSRVGAKLKLIWPKQKSKKAYFPKCLPRASFIDNKLR